MEYNNNFLFSEAYIQDVFKNNKKDTSESDEIFDNICSWYYEYKNDWTLYEDIVLDTLGFEKEADGDYRWIKSLGKDVALVYLLNSDSVVGSTTKGKYYAVDAIKKASERKIDWIIVTNGYEWRLLNATGVSPYEHYFAVNISDALESNAPDAASRVFTYMFGADLYQFTDGDLLAIDLFKDKSDESEEKIEDILRSKAESILKGLCYGLKDNMNKSVFTEEDKKHIYEDAIILLYRLLFLGYAETRKLLPVRADDPDYQDSFTRLCETAREYYLESRLTEVGNSFDLWDRLDSHLRIYVEKNYNGGLFSNDDKPILKEYRIANKHLAPCLMELAYIAGRRKDYGQIIEYKDLSVRNLGAIYEGLLEYQLFIADELMVQRKSKEKVAYIRASETTLKNSDKNNLVHPGEIYLSQDALERKETGAYYTPEDVVDFIVKNTVGKKLTELKEELNEELREIREELSYEPVKSRRIQLQQEIDGRTVDFINERILSISIIDCAMGSGHFLVNAAYQISNFIVDILENNCWENDDINADVTYWRRKVVENCIFGIDINNLSVLLAKLSLWLISVTNDKALSFIDHHLKCGNSIVGTTTEIVQYINIDIPIFNMTKDQYMTPILRKYARIKQIGSDTKADVAMQREAYEEINADLVVIKRKLDYYLASMYAGGISDKSEFQRVMHADSMDFFDAEEFKRLFAYADENKFFHWELEFPEVFMKGGFDVAIGNPPYVEVEEKSYAPAVGQIASSRNLYSYMIGNCVDKTKPDGKVGVIVLMALVASKKMDCIRKKLSEVNGDVSFMSIDSATYPGRLFKGLMIRLTILNVNKKDVGNTQGNSIYTTNYMRFFQRERNLLFKNVPYSLIDKNMILSEKEGGYFPKIGSDIGVSVMRKMLQRTNKKLSDYIVKKGNSNYLYFRNTGAVYYCMAFVEPPYYVCDGKQKKSSTLSKVCFKPDINRNIPFAITHSTLFYWFWTVYSDCYHLTNNDIGRFPINLDDMVNYSQEFDLLAKDIASSLDENKERVHYNKSFGVLEYDQYRHRLSKDVFDKVDELLAAYYRFTDEEAFYIRNYDYKYRTDELETK